MWKAIGKKINKISAGDMWKAIGKLKWVVKKLNRAIRDALRQAIKRRATKFRKGAKRGDLDQSHSAGGQPVDASDGVSQRQQSDLETQAAQTAALFPQ